MSVRAALNCGVGMVRFARTPTSSTPARDCPQPRGRLLLREPRSTAGDRMGRWPDPATTRWIRTAPTARAGASHPGCRCLHSWPLNTWPPVSASDPHKILTPHAGELERFRASCTRLLPSDWGSSSGDAIVPSRRDIDAEPFRWARAASELSGATVMPKGGYTIIAGPQRRHLQRGRRNPGWPPPVAEIP